MYNFRFGSYRRLFHRTLRRAHTASDRQARLLRAEHRAAGLTEGSAGEHTNDTGDDASDGYGQALREWNIKQAIERARGRARVFLRQLWYAATLLPGTDTRD